MGSASPLAPVSAFPETSPGFGYVTASLILPTAEGAHDGATHRTYIAAPGGWSVGWAVEGGVFVTSTISIEGAVARTGVMRPVQPSRYFQTYHTERRDTFLSVGLRLHQRVGEGVTIEPVGAFDVVHGEAWWTVEQGSYTGGPTRFEPRWSPDVPRAFGVSGGLDMRLGGHRVAVVPSFRVHRVFRAESTTLWPGGESRWTIRSGVGLRLAF